MNRLQARVIGAIVDELELVKAEHGDRTSDFVALHTNHPVFHRAAQLELLAPLLAGALASVGHPDLAMRLDEACA